jgi:hypothetical protein
VLQYDEKEVSGDEGRILDRLRVSKRYGYVGTKQDRMVYISNDGLYVLLDYLRVRLSNKVKKGRSPGNPFPFAAFRSRWNIMHAKPT